MPTIALDDTPFEGRTSNLTRLAPPAHARECLRCGSSLRGHYIGRVNGVDVWRCRCRRERRIRREAAM